MSRDICGEVVALVKNSRVGQIVSFEGGVASLLLLFVLCYVIV